MKAKKSDKTLESLKTVAICLLFLCAVALSALYFYRSGFIFSKGSAGAGNTDAEQDQGVITRQFEGLILPESIAVRFEGNHTFAISQGDGYMRLIYRLVCQNISVALSRGCTAEEAEELAWTSACDAEEFILVKYHAPLSHTVIYADSVSNLGDTALKSGLEDDIGAVDQLFLFPGKTKAGSIFGVARNRDGKVFNLILNEPINAENILTAEDFDIYVNASAMTLADLFCHTSENKSVLGSTILHTHGLNSQKLVFTQGYTGIIEDTALSHSVASFFDINPDKSGSYYDEKTQSTVYVSTHGSLHVGEGGISYSAAGETGGIPLSVYSDAFSANGITAAEAIVLTQSFISGYSAIDRRFAGGDAHPVLSAVYSDSGKITLEYIYCYSNVEIEGSGIACQLTLKNDRIVNFEATSNIYRLSEGGERRQSLLPEWILNMSLPQAADGLYTLKYRYRTSDMFAEWVAVKTK